MKRIVAEKMTIDLEDEVLYEILTEALNSRLHHSPDADRTKTVSVIDARRINGKLRVMIEPE